VSDQPHADATAPLAGGGSSSLADGRWHRMHPLTPLFRGGLVLVVVIGVIVANLRDRVIHWVIVLFGGEGVDVEYDDSGDPVGWAIDWTVGHNLVLYAALAVLALLLIVCGLFWLSWRKHEFRITGEHVEIRRGVIFRSQRRAPLDRVQGVNLTRPFIARLAGMAKLEVDGAGTDANVPLEYLGTQRAEQVRRDILRLASGVRAEREQARAERAAGGVREVVTSTVSEGVQGLIDGVDTQDVAPESLVRIPTGRIIGSQALDAIWIVIFFVLGMAGLAVVLVPAALSNDEGPTQGFLILGGALFAVLIPMVISLVAFLWSRVSKSLRYSIAETPNGVRVTHGLTTTTSQTIPPGRIHALEVTQPLFWKPFGWWKISVNRVSGKSQSQQQSSQAQQSALILPVGTRVDVERVLRVCMPHMPIADLALMFDHGMLGPAEGTDDAYRRMTRRGWWRRPVSFRRHGIAVSDFGVYMRRGVVWRKQAVFPLARLQGFSVAQGPIDRAQRIAYVHAHAVPGAVSGEVVGLDRDDAQRLLDDVTHRVVGAAARDGGHRWGLPQAVPGTLSALPPMVAAPAWAGAPAPAAPGQPGAPAQTAWGGPVAQDVAGRPAPAPEASVPPAAPQAAPAPDGRERPPADGSGR